MEDRVLIIGAGVIGATTALALAEKGFSTTLIDKASQLGEGASGDNGAQLSYSNTDALAAPDVLWSIPRLLMRMDSSFRMHPMIDIDFVKWSSQFIFNCSRRNSETNTLNLLQISMRSHEVMQDWCAQYNFQFNHRVSKKLHVYENAVALENVRRRVELKNQFGANQRVVDKTETLDIEPALERMNASIVGAVYSPEEEVGDVKKFTVAAVDKALEIGGGKLLLETEYLDLLGDENNGYKVITSKGDIDTDYIVLCAGFQSSVLARGMGVSCPPICPMAGYSLTFPNSNLTPEVSLTDTENKIVLCRLGDQLRVAGMADIGRVVSKPPSKRIEMLRNIVTQRFPDAGDYSKICQSWAGIRPMTANNQPIIGELARKNIFINAGQGMLGWTLAAGSAKVLTNLITHQST